MADVGVYTDDEIGLEGANEANESKGCVSGAACAELMEGEV